MWRILKTLSSHSALFGSTLMTFLSASTLSLFHQGANYRCSGWSESSEPLVGWWQHQTLPSHPHFLVFCVNGQIYEQTDGIAMGSLLSPAIAILFMEKFDEEVLNRADYKPMCWFWYVDATFIVWPHGSNKLDDFLNHLNGNNPNIQFTVETETYSHLPFLDTDTHRRLYGSLGHTVYRKLTHTDLYMNDKLDKLGVPLRPRLKSTTSTSSVTIQRNQPWPSTA